MAGELSRREFLKTLSVGTGAFLVGSTGLIPISESLLKTDAAFAAQIGTFPREETLIARILTGRVGTPDNFNQWVGWKWQDRGIQNLADEPLWSVDFATGEIINGVAAGDPVYNADFTTLTIPLREGVAWSDGTPFTAADVVYTVETLMAFEGFNAHTFFVDNVESVTAVDDLTVEFVLKQANSRFHTTFLDRWGCTRIFPKHIFETQEDPTLFTFNPYVGCGPYKLHSFDPQGSWTAWEKREDWDKSPTGIMYGEPQPRYIIYQYFADEGAQILAQLTHQLDIVELSADGLKALLAQAETSRAYQPTFPFVVNNDPAITGIVFNTARAPFDNRDVRWALTLAIEIVEYTSIAVDSSGTLSPVHIPHLGPYPELYIGPMQEWLTEFTIDIGNGETFAPYDPEAARRVADYARSRGYVFPEDDEFIIKTFGYGWYKYAPDIAERLLVNNGFSRGADNMWLLPDGTPWRISYMTGTVLSNHDARNAVAAVQQWRKFGIDATVFNTENGADLGSVGDFDVETVWPGREPWGAGPDLYRVLDDWNSAYIKPVGERAQSSYHSRWSTPEMDDIIRRLRETDPFNTEQVVAIGIEGLKEVVRQMPSVPTYGYIGFIGWDESYWTNWPGSENPYAVPYSHWPNFKYVTPFLRPAGQA
ncbi:MAG: ABC transporter substrate-binding protein [Anaerolineae bacterium]|uniref:ABC transporter substrate-binding protein n=1 Tax=Candidatus Flexifilum breve TaxID=3140694 RepID=UPI001AC50E1C|nr:ABC transporter substrate-binding protein [Chloroflexota bacterium]MBN8636369.1 ABC transporter substrate-binding protein [Anaerolineae bacterium]